MLASPSNIIVLFLFCFAFHQKYKIKKESNQKLCYPMFWLLMLDIIQLFCDQAEVATTKYNL